MEHTVSSEADPLQRLVQGQEVFVKLEPKSILLHAMESFGAKRAPVFSEIDCGDDGVKVSIEIDVSELRTLSGERISLSVVQGQPSFNRALAESNAVMAAFKHLQENHLISILDFSSRLSHCYAGYKMYDLVVEAMGAVEQLFTEWEMTLDHCDNIETKLLQEQFNNTVAGYLTDKGKVYDILSDPLGDLLYKLHNKTSNARAVLNEVEEDRIKYQNKMALKEQRLPNIGPFHVFSLSSKDILNYVLSFFSLAEAKYTSSPDSHGMVMTSLLMKFPYMEKHQFSGPVSLSANGENSIESAEVAAFKALVFMEKYYGVRVGDFNYSQRKKAFKHLNKLIEMLSKVLESASALRMMSSKLNDAIEWHAQIFSFHPSTLFSGEFSEGQIEAYRFCSSAIEDMNKYSVNGFGSRGEHIVSLQKLTWKLLTVKSDLAI